MANGEWRIGRYGGRLLLRSSREKSLPRHALARQAPKLGHGRFIRIVDGTSVPRPRRPARTLWRIHGLHLPAAISAHHRGQKLDSIPVVKGEIRLGDRAYMQPDRIAIVIEGGGDVVVRAGWKSVRWREANATPCSRLRRGGERA